MSTASPVHVNNRAASGWFWTLTAMIFVMAVVGAITRLTESGLSIMEWAPIAGSLPPLNSAEWDRLFALYQQTDEYRLQWQADMSMADFQSIFWWEWIHRLWGRMIGLVALAGFIWGIVAAVRSCWLGDATAPILDWLGCGDAGRFGLVHGAQWFYGRADGRRQRAFGDAPIRGVAAIYLYTHHGIGDAASVRAQAELVSAGTLSLPAIACNRHGDFVGCYDRQWSVGCREQCRRGVQQLAIDEW